MLDELSSHFTRQYPRILAPLGRGVCQKSDIQYAYQLFFVPARGKKTMKKLFKLFALLASVAVLTACGGTETTTPTDSPEASPTESPEATTSLETVTAVKLIPIAVFKEIDINQQGEITQVQFVEYFAVKKKELTKEDAEKNFQELDKDGTGTLTKEEATGEK